MPRETVAAKATRYLAEGRVTVERVERHRVAATCRGDGTRYRLRYQWGALVVRLPRPVRLVLPPARRPARRRRRPRRGPDVSDLELARLGALVAAELDQLGYRSTGVVRHMARRLSEPASGPTEGGCHGCGVELAQPTNGGRRLWCTESCRRRHRR